MQSKLQTPPADAGDAGVSRRWFFQAATALAGGALYGQGAIAPAFAQSSQQQGHTPMPKPAAYFAYVGARTTKERNARGEGLNVYRVDAETGSWTHVQLVKGLENPSYLAFDRTRRFLYCVHGDLSDASAFRIDAASGRLTLINHVDTAGKNPVHLVVDPTNRFVVVANHITSTVVVLERNEDGSLGKLADSVTLTGKIGPHRVEQPFAKPHQVEFDRTERFLVVPDKGLDRVFVFTLDPGTGKLKETAGSVAAREGAGPRHVAFHPNNAFAYVVNELDSTVTAYRFDATAGALTAFQVVTTLPDTFVGNSRAAEIAVAQDGNFLYASNRGHDSIVTFAIEPATGRLTHRGWTESRGKTPRFFAFDAPGRWLFVANEESDSIVPFRTDPATGKLTAAGAGVATGSPVCIVFNPAV